MSFGMPYGVKERDGKGKMRSVNTINGERFVYYERLLTDAEDGTNTVWPDMAKKVYQKAKDVLKWRIDYGGNPENISAYFGKLASYEFGKEKALLETYFKTSYDPNSPLCGQHLIEAFNLVLSTKEIFERCALVIGNSTAKSVFSFFPTYLNKALEDWITDKEKEHHFLEDVDNLIVSGMVKGRSNTEKIRKAVEKNIDDHTDEIVQLALEKMFSADIEPGLVKKVDEKERERLKNAYKEVFDALKKVENTAKTNEFVRGIAQNYKLNGNLGKIVADNLKGTKVNIGNVQQALSGVKFKVSTREAGSLAGIDTEFFGNFLASVSLSNKGVQFDSIHTGGGLSVNQKADMMYTIGLPASANRTLRYQLENFRGTGRGTNVEDVKKLLENSFKGFGNENGFILLVNSKNWTLNRSMKYGYAKSDGKLRGYSAGSPIDLNTWDDMMHAMNIRGRDFIFTIMQLIPGAIGNPNGDNENLERVSDMFARAIGSALFDDFEPDDPYKKKGPDLKTVHLLYLNGVYVPLSVFYTLLYEAFGNLQDAMAKDELVAVEFDMPSSILWPTQAEQNAAKDEHPWTTQSNEALTSIKVTYHFLAGFKKFMEQYYKLP